MIHDAKLSAELAKTKPALDNVSRRGILGGAGALEHFPPAVDAGADAVLAATVFHFGTVSIAEVKDALVDAGHPVR